MNTPLTNRYTSKTTVGQMTSFSSDIGLNLVRGELNRGHRLIEPDDRELLFDINDRLTQITDRNNNSQTLT